MEIFEEGDVPDDVPDDFDELMDAIRKFVKSKWKLFVTALFQVTFVAMNVLFISHKMVLPMLITGFMISLVWTLNVKRVAFGGWGDRIVYSTGAMAGTGLGYLISNWIISI